MKIMNIKMKWMAVIAALFMLMPMRSSAQKFAYVDTDYILSQMPVYKSAQAQINELSEKWQTEVEGMYEVIDKMHKEYQAEKVLLTKEMQIKREDEIIAKERDAKKYQNEKFGYQGELFKKREELIKPIQDKVYEAINKVAKERGLDFIFDRSGDMLMLVSNPKYDYSDEVLSELGVVPSETDEEDPNNLPPDGDLPPR
jgi:outer membrane protein